jgi:regulator of protease activity HflC (stomatin/prohibitin superfamily)
MEWLKQIWEQLSSLLRWWVIILPWEQGIKVWLGKKQTLLKAGIYFRVPYFHTVYVQPCRINFINLSPQTLTTKSGDTVTIGMIVGYSIRDVSKLYNSVNEVQGAICGFIQGNVSSFVSSSTTDDSRPNNIEDHVKDKLTSTDWGLDVSEIRVTNYAIVKTYRLIQDQSWMNQGHGLDMKR